jgi:uncharacterized protein (TIGR00251 family)
MELRIHVVPKSARTELAGTMGDGAWKVRVAAPADKGKANEALREFLARHLNVAPSRVEIVSGHTSRVKRVRIAGL